MHRIKTAHFLMDEVPMILWDYDDTLGGVRFPDGTIHPGAEAYSDTIRRFLAYMECSGFNREAAQKQQHDIDLILAQQHGFSNKTRFACSMVQAYEALGGADKAHKDAIFSIGMSVFTDYPYVPLEGALEALYLTRDFFRHVVVTKGEVVEQEKKLQQSGIIHFVDDVFVVGKKDAADWEAVLGSLNLPEAKDVWAIGNSVKADVNPLLALGYNGIHIKDKNWWVFEHAEMHTPYEGRTAVVVENVIDVLNYLPNTR